MKCRCIIDETVATFTVCAPVCALADRACNVCVRARVTVCMYVCCQSNQTPLLPPDRLILRSGAADLFESFYLVSEYLKKKKNKERKKERQKESKRKKKNYPAYFFSPFLHWFGILYVFFGSNETSEEPAVSLFIKEMLLCVCVCVCERERESERWCRKTFRSVCLCD